MLYAIIAVLGLIADQGLKYWTTSNLPQVGDTAPLLPGVLRLTYVQNRGAAFGIFEGQTWLFLTVTALFLVIVIYALANGLIKGTFGRVMAALVLAGALGNGIDRGINGYVVDMLELEFMKFQVFNIADCFITVCGILFCLYILLDKDALTAGPSRGRAVAKNRAAPRGGTHASGSRSDKPAAPPERPRPAQTALPWEDPFSEKTSSPAAGRASAPEAKPTRPAPARPVPAPAPTRPAVAPVSETRPAATPKKPGSAPEKTAPVDEFSLDAIMAEYGDE